MPSAGDSLGGRYRLADRIAAGGMGEVWQAVDTVLDRPVAVKVLLAGVSAQITFQRRFAHEARAMAALRHPGVAAVYDYGTTDEGAYLVMARIDGQSLERRLATGGRLSPAETMTIVAQAARALHAAHQAGIVHRDVTPGNLIIEPDGNVVLVDFGVARSSASETLTGARNVIGTASYMAPEQVSKREFGPAVDLYALGAVAFHCLTGEPPFTGDDPVAIALRHVTERPPPLPAGVPPKVRALVGRCLAKDPAARHPSGAALAAAASAAGGGDSTLLASEAATIPLPSLPAPAPGPRDSAGWRDSPGKTTRRRVRGRTASRGRPPGARTPEERSPAGRTRSRERRAATSGAWSSRRWHHC
ncbi:serine/threonine-protein kinase [Actinoplanes sp. G11-F43]|uniref:serine/threonine-protein kinase n=1 Tax=Actinoplanes sp. G11-F43 TaxID=3424130 RepID=UPI003D32CC6E